METNEVMIDIGKPEDEVQSQKDAQAARFGKIINYLSVFLDDLTIINRSRSNLKIIVPELLTLETYFTRFCSC